jgi:transposase
VNNRGRDRRELAAFPRPEKLVSYARLALRVHQSGQARPRSGLLSRSGSWPLGWAAVEAAQQAWRESNPWHEVYRNVSRRSGSRTLPRRRAPLSRQAPPWLLAA